MRRLFGPAALLLVVACGPSIKPAMQQATDARIGSYSSSVNVAAPASYSPREWKAGQWVAFRTTEGDKPPGVTILKVLAGKQGGFIIETEMQDYYGRSISQSHYRSWPKTPDEAADAFYKVVTRNNDDDALEIDFESSPMGGFIKSTMKHVTSGVTGPTDAGNLPKESVTVAAGSFAGSAKFNSKISFGPVSRNVTAWYHPAVPINGSVKAFDEKGWTYELLAFGETGATSALP